MLINRNELEQSLRDYAGEHAKDFDIEHAAEVIINETYAAIDTCADVWDGRLSEAAANSMLYHPRMTIGSIDWWSTEYIDDVLQDCEVDHEEA